MLEEMKDEESLAARLSRINFHLTKRGDEQPMLFPQSVVRPY